MTKSKLLDKLAKLKAMEESARHVGNVEEAEAFAAKVNELLLRHKISMSEVELKEQEVEDPIEEEMFDPEAHGIGKKQKRIQWQNSLAHIVAGAHFCQILVSQGTNRLWFVGRKSDRQVAMYLFSMLVREIAYHCEREFRREYHAAYPGDTSHMRGWKPSFKNGVLESLRRRFAAMRTQVKSESTKKQQAIIRVADNAVSTWVDERYSSKASRLRGNMTRNMEGYAAGKAFGNRVNIGGKGVTSGSGTKSLKK